MTSMEWLGVQSKENMIQRESVTPVRYTTMKGHSLRYGEKDGLRV